MFVNLEERIVMGVTGSSNVKILMCALRSHKIERIFLWTEIKRIFSRILWIVCAVRAHINKIRCNTTIKLVKNH